MGQLVNLVFQCLGILLVVVAQRLYCNTCCKIQIFFSIDVVKMHALTFIQNNLIAIICMEDRILGFFNIWITHDNIFPPYLPE